MAEAFLSLSRKDQLEALGVAATASGRPVHLLEKDVWVVWVLGVLFESQFAEHLVFKGGTSLSKAYQVIRRFSEDIDVTYDIRALAPKLVGDAAEALPATPSQEKKWSKEIRGHLLPAWLAEHALPLIRANLENAKVSAKARAEGESVYIEYDALTVGSGYVAPVVKLEFGARSTGEPAEVKPIVCDAARLLGDLVFPTASPRVMKAERTFWEKATAIHVYCRQKRVRGDRFARHWHDVARLHEAGFALLAMRDRPLAQTVARHKGWFFAEKDSGGAPIDYFAAVSGALQLVPDGDSHEKLRVDYESMVADGLLLDDAETFDSLIKKCGAIQEQVNAAAESATRS